MMLYFLNIYRSKITGFLTRGIGQQQLVSLTAVQKESIKRILVVRPNHRLGNQILISPIIQELEGNFKNCEIDLFLKGGLGPIIYKNYNSVGRLLLLPKDHFKNIIQYFGCWFKMSRKKYDLVINAAPNSSSGKLATRISKARYKVYGNYKNEHTGLSPFNCVHLAQIPVYNLRYFFDFPLQNTVPPLKIRLDENEITEGKKSIENLFKNDKKTIAIFTYATGNKCYSEDWWLPFYRSLIKQFGAEYNILEILPKENISKIGFKAVSFYSNDIREIGGVMHNTELLVAADSGMMHLGSAAGIPVIGLFSNTNIEKYKPYGNGSLPINTTTAGVKDILTAMENALVCAEPEINDEFL